MGTAAQRPAQSGDPGPEPDPPAGDLLRPPEGGDVRVPWRRLLSLLLTVLAGFAALWALLYLLQERLIFLPRSLRGKHAAGLSGGFPGSARSRCGRRTGRASTAGSGTGPKRRAPVRALVIYFGGQRRGGVGAGVRGGRARSVVIGGVQLPGLRVERGAAGRGPRSSRTPSSSTTSSPRSEDVDPERIAVFGRSLGSAVAVPLAAARPVRGVLLVSPFDSLKSVGQRHYPFVPVSLMLRHPFDSLAHAPAIDAPLLALAGERDRIVPSTHSPAPARRVARPEAVGPPPGGRSQPHLHLHPGYWPAIRDFLGSLDHPR